MIALSSAFAAGTGIAIGTWFQRRQPVSVAATIAAVEAFALAGGLGVIFFEPVWLQRIAVYDPLTYAIHGLQQAVFYASASGFASDVAVLALSAVAAAVAGSWPSAENSSPSDQKGTAMSIPLRLAMASDGRIAATTRPRPPMIARPGATVTLKDVAARANVHPATASRALHASTRHLVRPGTARQVIRAAEALGYVANHTAASLRTRSTRTVGVLLPDLADPLTAAFARGLEDQLGAAGYVALTGSTDRDAAREHMLLTVMRGRHVDGFILAGDAARAPLAAAAAKTGLPVVIAGTVPEGGTLPAVSPDFARGMRMVVDHLTASAIGRSAASPGPGRAAAAGTSLPP